MRNYQLTTGRKLIAHLYDYFIKVNVVFAEIKTPSLNERLWVVLEA
jgi:hypothetical protein